MRRTTRTSHRKNCRSRFPPLTWWCSAWRLGHLADQLQENSLAAVRAFAERYAEAVGHSAFVASMRTLTYCRTSDESPF